MSAETPEQVLKHRWVGFKVAILGAAIALAGGIIAFAFAHPFSFFLVLSGFVVGIVGAFIHIQQMRRESRLDQKELYPRTRQPWQ